MSGKSGNPEVCRRDRRSRIAGGRGITRRRVKIENPARLRRILVTESCRDLIRMSTQVRGPAAAARDIAARHLRADWRPGWRTPWRRPPACRPCREIEGRWEYLAHRNGVGKERIDGRHFGAHKSYRIIHDIVVAPAHHRGSGQRICPTPAAALRIPTNTVDRERTVRAVWLDRGVFRMITRFAHDVADEIGIALIDVQFDDLSV